MISATSRDDRLHSCRSISSGANGTSRRHRSRPAMTLRPHGCGRNGLEEKSSISARRSTSRATCTTTSDWSRQGVAVLGRAQGLLAHLERQTDGSTDGGSPVRLRQLRRCDPRRLRRGHRHAVGPWQLDPRSRRRRAALVKGDLKFSLDGYKLKGSWVLVRTRDRDGTPPKQRERNWLLIKHADFWSGPVDITEFAPLSVKSDPDFDDILAADIHEVWVTGRPATATGGGAAATLTRHLTKRAAGRILAHRKKKKTVPAQAMRSRGSPRRPRQR